MIKSWMLAVALGFGCVWIGCGSSASGTDQPVGPLGHDAGSDVAKAGSGGAAGMGGAAGSGVCTPGAKQCSGNTPQACDSNGQWLDGVPCKEPTVICNAGGCAFPCSSTGCGALEECFNGLICVAKQVSIAIPEGGTYRIDATEVTRSQYTAWFTLGVPIAGQADKCSWNLAFTPAADCLADPTVCKGAGCDNHPQVCVDWCDAYAYCGSIGKRLCGRVGGGSLASSAWADPGVSQWYTACSSDGALEFPYGEFDPLACNIDSGTTVEVASMKACSTADGVFDLSGNVSEWEDSCDSNAPDGSCHWRGGHFQSSLGTQVECAQPGSNGQPRDLALPWGGFRCCSDP